MRETEIAAKLIEWFDQTTRVYTEVPVVLDGQTVSIDVVSTQFGGRVITAWECKVVLGPILVAQAIRWLPYANRVYAVIAEPRQRSSRWQRCLRELKNRGVGLVVIRETKPWVRTIALAMLGRRDGLIESALSMAQQHGPPAGSAGVRRHAADKWEGIRETLIEFGPMTIRELKLDVLGNTRDDWLQFQRDVRAGRVPMISCDPHQSPTVYRAEVRT